MLQLPVEACLRGSIYSGLVIKCKADEFIQFNPPSGQTCIAWADEFVQGFGGYIDNPNDTSACRYCQYSVGDQFFLPLNIRYDNRWRDVWILFAYSVFNFGATISKCFWVVHARNCMLILPQLLLVSYAMPSGDVMTTHALTRRFTIPQRAISSYSYYSRYYYVSRDRYHVHRAVQVVASQSHP